MSHKRLAAVAALFAAGTVLLSACGGEDGGTQGAAEAATRTFSLLGGTAKSNNATPKTGDWATGADGTANTAQKSVAQKWVQLEAGAAGDLDPVVVNGAGLTLYRFDKDTASPSKSNCDGDCAVTWPPVTVAKNGRIFIDGVEKSAVGVVERGDGSLQVTIGGWPVYRFAKDTKPGDTLGQGVGGTWFGVTPDGQKAGADSGDAAEPSESVVVPQGDGQKATSAILFDEPGFSDSGASQGVSGQGCQNLARPNLTSSIRAEGSLKIWSEKDCTGESTVIDGDVEDLSTIGFDDTVASVFLG
ncbi:hypothetical protein [Actinophytocola oryzae]|uniref:Putative lipoprotein with Yx(FWY)xxD motif n=1 Tax=Actinophytocola oryzae TaxID=502181 RepID=A0A4R7UU65_9PSEU|nr:hypothetical protein [Actinophytocola oryzae]TDV38607.1 putative lipoprotein with Yx(FWY)xxD motif [Actinophytocola oryzae]